jgi:hypothetical protein
MATRIISCSCVEINISVCDDCYLAELQVDGVSREQLKFTTEDQFTNWVNTILSTPDLDLYVRVRTREVNHRSTALELAEKLSCQGVMIGISGQQSVCRSKEGRLQSSY